MTVDSGRTMVKTEFLNCSLVREDLDLDQWHVVLAYRPFHIPAGLLPNRSERNGIL